MVDESLVVLIIDLALTVAGFWLLGEALIRIIVPAAKRAGLAPAQLIHIKDWIRLISTVLIIGAVVRLTGLASEFTTLTVSGFIAIAFSLTLQATLTNIIAGIMVLLDNTLRLNDEIQYGMSRGRVSKIGLRNCWITTPEGHIVIISNNLIANGPLTNFTATDRLQKKTP